ncbi:MAG: ribonuclease P protein component [Paludibacteraceae bacterium]|nr:ribonuclease P protein component [Paludibacteraceae bacterium]
MPETFKKQERLCSETAIETLFKGGRKVRAFPFLAICLKRESSEPARILISVAKKRFHHAVDRNSVKRKVRAAYRTSGKFPAGYDVALVYIGNGDENVEFLKQQLSTINSQLSTLN